MLYLYVGVLQAIDPEEVAVVTVAASKEVIFEGGPQPWVVDPSGYYEKGKTIRESVNLKPLFQGHYQKFLDLEIDC